MKHLVALAIAAIFMSSAQAADLGQCRIAGSSTLFTIESDAALTDEVVRLMNEAVNVADSEQWIISSRPAWVWASEAKVACGKAYGYLRYNVRDEQNLDNCECFYRRMQQYMY